MELVLLWVKTRQNKNQTNHRQMSETLLLSSLCVWRALEPWCLDLGCFRVVQASLTLWLSDGALSPCPPLSPSVAQTLHPFQPCCGSHSGIRWE